MKNKLIRKIKSRKAVIAIIGLGYVGLPLAVEFAKKGFKIIGIDVDPSRVKALNDGKSYVEDIPTKTLAPLVRSKKISATKDFSAVADADAVIICVPTPLNKSHDPDMSYILDSVNDIKKYIKPGKLVVLESTTYPGTTEEVLLPAFQSVGLVEGKTVFLAHSPERIDPGNKFFGVHNTPKVVGGISPAATETASALYGQIIKRVVPVSSPSAAEMTKILENTFRGVNIALVNELAVICDRLNLNVWEIIDAASTKPFGFMPFYPGPGIGGHCIPVDPLYLAWKLRTLNYNVRFIELAREVNSNMPNYVVQKIVKALNDFKKGVRGSKVLVLGVSYKKDISDLRESPALDIIERLADMGANLYYSDPYVPKLSYNTISLKSVPFTTATIKKMDCVAIVTDHSVFNYSLLAKSARCVVDSRNAMRDFIKKGARAKITRI